MTNEIFRKLAEFDNYEISNLGTVKRMSSNFIRKDGVVRFFNEKVLIGNKNKGYRMVSLQVNNVKKKYPVHRLVAQTFIENPNILPCVNHKNGIRDDNRVENLEWCTFKENVQHAITVLGIDMGIQNRKKIICITNGKEYVSTREAKKDLGIKGETICGVLKGKRTHTHGYKFKYA